MVLHNLFGPLSLFFVALDIVLVGRQAYKSPGKWIIQRRLFVNRRRATLIRFLQMLHKFGWIMIYLPLGKMNTYHH